MDTEMSFYRGSGKDALSREAPLDTWVAGERGQTVPGPQELAHWAQEPKDQGHQ